MGTRSDIIVHRADGKWARIYCHWDGYLDHNGKILFEHYSDQAKAEALVALGNLSSLGEEIGEEHDFDFGMKMAKARSSGVVTEELTAEYERLRRMCNAYGRDRGEVDVEAMVRDSLQAIYPSECTWTEFTYVWDEGKWWAGDPDEGTQALVLLEDALSGKEKIHSLVKTPFGITLGRH